ncbi:MAG TPA: flagellar hook-length control protein FliK [Steroidobacteraceae bacterium]|jgi:flagellar hook-length control protein FliK|nr:flagellar hook-length control protein FliK [Steroidobacteraceae bacterium]
MNAIPPISPAPSGSDAAQLNAPASAASPPSRGANQDFARALSAAGGKPVRKGGANKHDEAPSSGSALPAPGNQPPPAPASPVAVTPLGPLPAVNAGLPAGAPAADAAAIAGAQGGTPGADPSAIPAALSLQANGGGTAALAADFGLPGTPASGPGGNASATAGSGDAPAGAAVVPGSALSVPQAPSIRTLASTAAAATRIPPVPQGGAADAKSSGSVASQGAGDPASSQTSGANAMADPTLNGPAATDASASAQAVMAAAVVQGTGAPAADFSSPSNDSVGTDVPQGIAAASDAPAGVSAAALAHAAAAAPSAATSAAATAATAARVALEVSGGASTGGTDKCSHATSLDFSLPGTSNDGSAGAAQLLTSNAPSDSVSVPTLKVAAGVDTAGFGQGVADKVSLMMDGNLTSAKLQVNPPALGPIEVRIALQGGHAQVWLSSHSAVTRDALESSSPKLREMLGSQGFSQVSVDISQRSFQDRSPPSQAYEAAPAVSGDAPVLAHATTSISRSALGLLDAYA